MRLSQLQSASRVLIYGYGVEGQSTEKFLKAHQLKNFEIHDDKNEAYNSKKDLADYDIIIISAGINRLTVIPEALLDRCTSNTEMFFHNLSPANRRKTIGITGTKGKSMTAKFAYELLQNNDKKVAIAGNYGNGLLDFLDQMDDLEFIVMELSSFQLAYLNRSVHIAMCTNLFEDHLDWHGNKANYHAHKANLWKYQTEADFLYIPYRYCKDPSFETDGEKVVCGSLYHQFFEDEESIWHAQHYLQNFGLVHELHKRMDLGEHAFKQTAKELKPLPHRMSFSGEINGVKFYDNAIATNPHATTADIAFLQSRLGSIIMGGSDRGIDLKPVFDAMVKNHVRCHVIVQESDSSDKIIKTLEAFPHLPYSKAKDMKEAIKIAIKETPPNKVCVLSPACASWDRYSGYGEKGDEFTTIVQANIKP